jgi:hypothetical protein
MGTSWPAVGSTRGGVIANNIARWNGTSGRHWARCDHVLGLHVREYRRGAANGDVVAGGYLVNTAGGVAVSSIARWNGTSWSALGGGTAASCEPLRSFRTGMS